MPKQKKATNKTEKNLEKDLEVLREDLLRAQADLVNYRNRVEREKSELMEFSKVMIIRQLLPLFDNLERALSNVPPELDKNDWATGVKGVAKQLSKSLNDIGIKKLETIGEVFDPNIHEAVSAEGDGEIEVISEELQAGYKSGDEIIRPAMVRVKRIKKSDKKEK